MSAPLEQCLVAGCDAEPRAKGFCPKHYQQNRKNRPLALRTDVVDTKVVNEVMTENMKEALEDGGEPSEAGGRVSMNGSIFRKIPPMDRETIMAACRLFGKQPEDLVAERLTGWLREVKERIAKVQV